MYGWYAWKRNWTWQRRRSKTKLGQEGENVKEILVVGGGAAGIAAALSAAEAGGRVTILEGLNRPGKNCSLLGTGGAIWAIPRLRRNAITRRGPIG